MPRWMLLSVFCVALVLRLLYLGWVFDGPDSLRRPDSRGYEIYAAWLAGEIPAAERPDFLLALRTPGYPAYLMAFRVLAGPDPLWPVLGQCVIDALLCVLTAALAWLVEARLGLLAGLLAAVNLNLIAASAVLLSETLFLLLFVAGLLAFVRTLQAPSLLAASTAGACMGLATLVRPATQFFPVLLLAALPLASRRPGPAWRRQVACGAALLLAFGLVLAPRFAQTHATWGEAQLSSLSGYSSYRYMVPLIRAWARGTAVQAERAELERRLEDRLAEQGLESLPENPFAATTLMGAVALEAAREVGLGGLLQAWLAPALINVVAPSVLSVPAVRELPRPRIDRTSGDGALGKVGHFLRETANSAFFWWVGAGAALTLIFRLVEAAGVVRLARPGTASFAPTLFLLASGAYFLVVNGPHANVRYRIPVEPLLCVFLASGLVWLREAIAARRVSKI